VLKVLLCMSTSSGSESGIEIEKRKSKGGKWLDTTFPSTIWFATSSFVPRGFLHARSQPLKRNWFYQEVDFSHLRSLRPRLSIMKVPLEDKVLALHPQGKRSVHISREKYEVIRNAILRSLKDGSEKTHLELYAATRKLLPRNFEGSPMWYFETVKLDLEARGLIERKTSLEPNRYQMR